MLWRLSVSFIFVGILQVCIYLQLQWGFSYTYWNGDWSYADMLSLFILYRCFLHVLSCLDSGYLVDTIVVVCAIGICACVGVVCNARWRFVCRALGVAFAVFCMYLAIGISVFCLHVC